MVLIHPLASVVALAATSILAAASSAPAVGGPWSPLQDASGSTLAVALNGGTAALISIGGPDDATVYDQRRTADGTLSATTEVTSVEGAEDCRPVEAATTAGRLAVAVECRVQTEFEDPPTRLVELVWTADAGWAWQVRREGVLGSIDWSPQGQSVVFASSSQYGRPHHVTTYDPALGWRDLTRRDRGGYGDELVAAVDDSGGVVVVRGVGFEDEPGYWFGGRLRIETYRAGSWTRELSRSFPDGGIDPVAVDLVAGRVMATVVRTRSTGRVSGRDSKVSVLFGTPSSPRFWSSPRWTRGVLAASAALTRDGVGVASWQVVAGGREATSRLATWAPASSAPSVLAAADRTTLTDAVRAGGGLDVSVSPGGVGVIGAVRHERGDDVSTASATTFRVPATGGVTDRAETEWQQPGSTSVTVSASDGAASITLGRHVDGYSPSPLTRYSVLAVQ